MTERGMPKMPSRSGNGVESGPQNMQRQPMNVGENGALKIHTVMLRKNENGKQLNGIVFLNG